MKAPAEIRRHWLADGMMAERTLAAEVAVAITCNGTTQAVMMATPADLVDFAYGFALTEGLATAAEITAVEPVALAAGIDLRLWLTAPAAARLAMRRRHMLGPVGCGLCGLDSLEQALRPLSPVTPGAPWLTPGAALMALAALRTHQPLHDATRAVHAAGWWTAAGMVAVREDVGRHNALDKLAGHLVRHGLTGPGGAVVLTSRISLDLVQKVAALGAAVLIAVSAPTTAAVDLAGQLGIVLLTRAGTGLAIHTHPEHLLPEVADAV